MEMPLELGLYHIIYKAERLFRRRIVAYTFSALNILPKPSLSVPSS